MKLPFLLLSTLATALAAEDFVPLSCNDPPPSTCSTWGDVVGGGTTYTNEVEIPCGQCVKFDVNTQLTFEAGLTILGKLVIEDGQTVDIVTKFVRVEGELDITSSKPVDGVPDVKITLIGTSDVTFTPADVNSGACGGTCGAGKKPIVVAGGKLTINGMPTAAPTWTHIHDVEAGSVTTTTDFEAFVPFPTDDCNLASDGIIIDEDFSDANNVDVEATHGTHVSFDNQIMKLHDRTSHYHGPQIDLKNVRGCIVEDRKYLITFKVRLTLDSNPSGNEYTECAASGENCLRIVTEWLEEGGDNGMRRSSVKYTEQQPHRTKYGEWFTIADDLTFSSDNAQGSNIYETIRIQGPGAGITMEIDDLVLRLPPAEAFPDPQDVCSDLIPGNGDAELLGLSPFPFYKNKGYTDLYVEEETPTNHYFVSTARQYAEYYANEDKDEIYDGMAVKLPFGCIHERSTYRLKARMRAVSASPTEIVIRWRSGIADTFDKTDPILTCPPSTNTWVDCEGVFSIKSTWVANSPEYYGIYFYVAPTVEYHLDYMTIEAEAGPIKNIVVEDSVSGAWAPGAEVLLTTYQTTSDKHQVRKIVNVEPSTTGLVVVELNETISRPSTVQDNPNFATEVALLSRNILFIAAEDDPNPKHGGHLIVFHTPGVNQQLEGVEVRNFGQAGNLGRYPIHFHLSGDNDGSIVKSNLIRESNQRCVVIHGTHNVNIEENVAFDTFGHCFMLEDGFETGNTFKKNLGALTKNQPSADVIPPIAAQNNGEETDGNSATYWITNPDNNFIDNVAAGCAMNGFWIELRNSVRGPMSSLFEFNPKKVSLGHFERNVAHGCHRGFRTYPNGYIPDEKAVFYDLRSYRNRGDGFFFHNSNNLQVQGGLFADNRRGIDIDRCDNMTVDSTQIVGLTNDYNSVMEAQNIVGLCHSSDYMVAVEFHLFTRDRQLDGATLRNVSISGLQGTGCDMEVAFRFDEETNMPNFDWWTTTELMTLEDGTEPFYFCQAEDVGVTNAYVTDKDSSLQPSSTSFTGTSTFLGDFPHMTTFVDLANCVDKVQDNCYYYCNVCLRTVEFEFDARNTEGYTLKVCDATTPSKCIEVDEVFKHDEMNPMNDYRDSVRRKFSVALPIGSYNAEVLDQNGNPTWPSFVTLNYEDIQCSNSLAEGSITMNPPPATLDADCKQLVRNGDAEADSTDFKYWVHRNSAGIELVPNAGLGSSNAFGDSLIRWAGGDGIGVYLDSRCIDMAVGREYEIKAYAQLYDKDNAQQIEYCDPNEEACPEVGLKGGDPSSFTLEPAAKMLKESSLTDGYQLIWGRVTITQEMADSGSLLLYVERNSQNGRLMHVDNVSMDLLDLPGADYCDELIFNNDFETGDNRGWNNDASIVSPGANGSYALHMHNRGSALQWVKTGCMEAGKRYKASGKYHLISHADGSVTDIADVTPSKTPGYYPKMTIKPHLGSVADSHNAARTVGNTALDWVEMMGYITATDVYEGAEKMSVYFNNIPSGYDMVVDELSISEVQTDCSDLVVNGEMNGFATIWEKTGGVISNTDAGVDGTAAVRVSGRTKTWHGLEYRGEYNYMDYDCLEAGGVWKVSAQIKLVAAGTDDPFMCDLNENSVSRGSCPDFEIRFQTVEDIANKLWDKKQRISTYPSAAGAWQADGFNLLEGTFTVPADAFPLGRVKVYIRDFPLEADLIVDNFSITPGP
eukprot:CAMPEP_0194026912 /NCGR_PEP_ID=MMETSP0009_2-20130614/1155_1 /TAXON_ID=210454 /ORGANISM="Grammatophora oceanica, Strain CCMP 410" /LENGTH=1694 /DNA_ID=CAMNT_0038665801 /DNA_START=100 /DNA_END=5184 /DNA_ORIENTATION=-